MSFNIIKKIISLGMLTLATILIISTFFKSDQIAIIGKWEYDSEYRNLRVYEFYRDGTGICYDVYQTRNPDDPGTALDTETYTYTLHNQQLTIDMGMVVRTYNYEISGNKLTLDGSVTYTRTGGAHIPWVRYVLSFLCISAAVVMFILKVPSSDTYDYVAKTEPADVFGGVSVSPTKKDAVYREYPPAYEPTPTPSPVTYKPDDTPKPSSGSSHSFAHISKDTPSSSSKDKGNWFSSGSDL